MIRVLVATVFLVVASAQAFALEVKEITSTSGIRAWFVERHVAPVVHVRFAFEGGSTSDEKGFEGTAMLMSGMLNEGAGPYDGSSYRQKVRDIGMWLGFDQGVDYFYGYMSVPVQYRKEAADLVKITLAEPHFPDEAIARMRDYYLSSEWARQQNPEYIAGRASLAQALQGHPYVDAFTLAPQGLPHVGRKELEEMRKRSFVLSRLNVVIVGDMSEAEAAAYLDQLFASLPQGEPLAPPPVATLAPGPQLEVIPAETAQTFFEFRLQGIPETDPDYVAATVATQIVEETLNELIREQRGMSYGVNFQQGDYRRMHVLRGRFSTANATAWAALGEVRRGLGLLRNPGVTNEQFSKAKAILKGQIALGFDAGSSMASVLLDQKISGLDSGFAARRESLIDQVTIEAVQRVIARLIDPGKLLVVAAGKPEGLSP